jgi:hypothetical protein
MTLTTPRAIIIASLILSFTIGFVFPHQLNRLHLFVGVGGEITVSTE